MGFTVGGGEVGRGASMVVGVGSAVVGGEVDRGVSAVVGALIGPAGVEVGGLAGATVVGGAVARAGVEGAVEVATAAVVRDTLPAIVGLVVTATNAVERSTGAPAATEVETGTVDDHKNASGFGEPVSSSCLIATAVPKPLIPMSNANVLAVRPRRVAGDNRAGRSGRVDRVAATT